jgi:superfamily II DNA/RNA helicase
MAAELSESERIKSVEAFKALGVHAQLAEAAAALNWKSPTPIQEQAVPLLLQGDFDRLRVVDCQSMNFLQA